MSATNMVVCHFHPCFFQPYTALCNMSRTMHESRHATCVARELTISGSTMFAKSWHSNNEGLPYTSILNTCEEQTQQTRRASHLWPCNTGSTPAVWTADMYGLSCAYCTLAMSLAPNVMTVQWLCLPQKSGGYKCGTP